MTDLRHDVFCVTRCVETTIAVGLTKSFNGRKPLPNGMPFPAKPHS